MAKDAPSAVVNSSTKCDEEFNADRSTCGVGGGITATTRKVGWFSRAGILLPTIVGLAVTHGAL